MAERAPARVVVVGLGPAGPDYLTRAARAALTSGLEVICRTARHPAAEPVIAAGASSCDDCYEEAPTFGAVYEAIVERVVAAAVRADGVVYAVPGSPFVLEATVLALRRDPRVVLETVPGLSFLDLAWERLGIDPVESHVRLVDAASFATDGARDLGPLLVAQPWSRSLLSEVKLAVDSPGEVPVVLLHHLGCPDEQILSVPWDEIDRIIEPDHLTSLYIPSLGEPVGAELARLEQVVAVLRERCPWDRVQTHRSLVRHLLEETYEAIEAIEELGDPVAPTHAAHLEEELGDLLCQVLFHARLATEEGLFSLADVARTTHDKLVHRHPHVFTDAPKLETAEAVVSRWEAIKQEEKGRTSLMEGIPRALPALALVAKIERKANSVGLGWEATGASDDELAVALEALLNRESDDFGGLVFALARLAAARGVDPEEAARQAAGAMQVRFRATEQAASAGGSPLLERSVEERLELYRTAGEPLPG